MDAIRIRTNNATVQAQFDAGIASASVSHRPALRAFLRTQRMPEWDFPFSTSPAMFNALRHRREAEIFARDVIQGRESTHRYVAGVRAHYATRIDMIRASEQFDARSMRALEFGMGIGACAAGVTIATIGIAVAAGAAIGAPAAGIGAIVGGACGLVAGVCAYLYPGSRLAYREDTRHLFAQMNTIQRMAFLGELRELNDAARKRDGGSSFGPWRSTDGAIQTVWGGAVQVVDWNLEDLLLCKYGDAPNPRPGGAMIAPQGTPNILPGMALADMPQTVRWAIGQSIAHLNDDVLPAGNIGTMPARIPHRDLVSVYPWFPVAWMADATARGETCGAIRQKIIDSGMPTSGGMPDDPAIDYAFAVENERLLSLAGRP